MYLVVEIIFLVAAKYPSKPKCISVAQHTAIAPAQRKQDIGCVSSSSSLITSPQIPLVPMFV